MSQRLASFPHQSGDLAYSTLKLWTDAMTPTLDPRRLARIAELLGLGCTQPEPAERRRLASDASR